MPRRRKRPPRGRVHAKTITPGPFSALWATVTEDVDARLGGFLDAKLDAARALGPETVEMVGALRDLALRGGKRLRAALLVAGYRAATSSDDLEPALEAGVAVELLQCYFLIHDDWMDKDDVRRGGPAVHVRLAERFGSRHLGASSAILCGDLAVALAIEALARADLPDRHAASLLACFGEMQEDAVLGQQLDVLSRSSDPERVYALKTSSYTVKGPLRLGAILGGGGARLLTALDRFALPAGIAFQLRDDLIGAFGKPAETGKPAGRDLVSGKRTALVVRAFERASRADRKLLERVFGNPRASAGDVNTALSVLERSGARDAVERRIDALVKEALAALAATPATREGRALLDGALRALTARRA